MKILLFGSSGFFGQHIKQAAIEAGHDVFETYGRKRYNLLCPEQTRMAFLDCKKPDLVINAAGHNGGLEFNRQYPADILVQNVTMANNIVNQARSFNVKNIVFLNAVCAYPDKHKRNMSEDMFLDGPPDQSVEFHAYSKRYLLHLAKSHKLQYGMNISNLCFTNLFGPGCSFDPVKSKVVEAVIKKLVDAKMQKLAEVEFWGTGSPKREFLYAPDAARFVLQFKDEEFINIGPGKSITIKELVNTINSLVGFTGRIKWDHSKGDGQSERNLKIREDLELEFTPFKEALQATINDYILRCGYKV